MLPCTKEGLAACRRKFVMVKGNGLYRFYLKLVQCNRSVPFCCGSSGQNCNVNASCRIYKMESLLRHCSKIRFVISLVQLCLFILTSMYKSLMFVPYLTRHSPYCLLLRFGRKKVHRIKLLPNFKMPPQSTVHATDCSIIYLLWWYDCRTLRESCFPFAPENYRLITILNVTSAANVGIIKQINKQCALWSLSYAE